jgi:phage-related protein
MTKELIKRSKDHLKGFSDKQRVLNELLKQLDKDFGYLLTENIRDKSIQSTEQMVQVLMPAVDTLQHDSPESMRQMMYKIDLSESILIQHLQGRDQAEHTEIICWLIVERELKKVVTRLHFADNKDAFKNL